MKLIIYLWKIYINIGMYLFFYFPNENLIWLVQRGYVVAIRRNRNIGYLTGIPLQIVNNLLSLTRNRLILTIFYVTTTVLLLNIRKYIIKRLLIKIQFEYILQVIRSVFIRLLFIRIIHMPKLILLKIHHNIRTLTYPK